jgi:hypothetical protein
MADYERLANAGGNSSFVLKTDGSRTMELILGGYRISGVVKRWDAEATSHSCSPNFDAVPETYQLPRHGLMRTTQAEVIANTGRTLYNETILKQGTKPIIEVRQIFTLSKSALEIETFNWNLSGGRIPRNFGIHQYYDTQGLKGVLLNDEPLAERIKSDAAFTWNAENTLVIPGKPQLLLTQEGLPVANSWTGQDKTGKYDEHYFSLSAVEGFFRENDGPVFFGSPESLISPRHGTYTRLVIALAA